MTGPKEAGHVAERFRDLQGLKLVPAGIAMLFLFAWTLVFPFTQQEIRTAGIGRTLWGLAVLLVGLALAAVAVRRVAAWYTRQYGSVEPTRRQRRLAVIFVVGGLLLFMVPFQIEANAQNVGQTVPVNLLDFALASLMIAFWLYFSRPHVHYVVFAGVGFVLGIASIAGIPPVTFEWHIREAFVYLGLAAIVGGVLDHRILTSMLAQPEKRIGIES